MITSITLIAGRITIVRSVNICARIGLIICGSWVISLRSRSTFSIRLILREIIPASQGNSVSRYHLTNKESYDNLRQRYFHLYYYYALDYNTRLNYTIHIYERRSITDFEVLLLGFEHLLVKLADHGFVGLPATVPVAQVAL